jgi:hypothetical protein
MAAGFDLRQWIATAAGVAALTVLGLLLPPLLIIFGIAGIVLAVRIRRAIRGLLLLGVIWLVLGFVLSLGLGTSTSTGEKNQTSSLNR